MKKMGFAVLLSVFIAPVFATSDGGVKTLSPEEVSSNEEHNKLMQQLLGVEIPVPQFSVDYKAEQSELGKLSKTLLGELFTHVQSINYISDDNAIVTVRMADLSCKMEFVTMMFPNEKEPTWKLNNLSCSKASNIKNGQ